jgi:N-methylhydantoinase B
MAQVAANEVGSHKVLSLLDEYGLAGLEAISNEIIGRSEAAMRAAIGTVPDGTYRQTVQLDGFDEPLQVACSVTIRGTEVFADLSGTSPQVSGAINAVGHVAFGRVAHAIKCALAPHIPNNEGLFRPIQVEAPEGSLVNARFPAPTAARHVLHFFISAAVFGALSQISPPLPGLIADSGAGMIQSVREQDANGLPRDYWIRFNHGMGALPKRDGYSGMCAPNNVGTTPIEIVEARTQAFFLKKEIVPDSGGAGKFRGGHAQEYRFRVLSDRPTAVACMFDRTQHPPLGYLGGLDGAPARVLVNDQPVHPKGRYMLSANDVMTVVGPGGGGFFPPGKRDARLVLEDVLNGLVSEVQARELYRVAVDVASRAIDWDETARLRAGADPASADAAVG